MFNLDPAKVLVVLVVALVVLGPDKLPRAARQVGAAWNQLRQWRARLEEDVRGAFPDLPNSSMISQAVRSPLSLLDRLADDHERSVAGSATASGAPGEVPAAGDAAGDVPAAGAAAGDPTTAASAGGSPVASSGDDPDGGDLPAGGSGPPDEVQPVVGTAARRGPAAPWAAAAPGPAAGANGATPGPATRRGAGPERSSGDPSMN